MEHDPQVEVNLYTLVENAMHKEQELQEQSEKLALEDKRFAEYLAAKKHADEELEVLWQTVKDYMIENKFGEFENDYIKLNLTPSGKYKTEDIEAVDDELCDIKKTLNNKKVKAYIELNGMLPKGVESTGFILRKKVK
jgi:hypothetical protein